MRSAYWLQRFSCRRVDRESTFIATQCFRANRRMILDMEYGYESSEGGKKYIVHFIHDGIRRHSYVMTIDDMTRFHYFLCDFLRDLVKKDFIMYFVLKDEDIYK